MLCGWCRRMSLLRSQPNGVMLKQYGSGGKREQPATFWATYEPDIMKNHVINVVKLLVPAAYQVILDMRRHMIPET